MNNVYDLNSKRNDPVAFIACSDFHLRHNPPVARKDQNWMETLERKTRFLFEVWKKVDMPPILMAGDLFHHWNVPPYMLWWCLENLPPLHMVLGQHDLPYHDRKRAHMGGAGVLASANTLRFLSNPHIEFHNATYFSEQNMLVVGFNWGDPLLPLEEAVKDVAYRDFILDKNVWKVAVVHHLCFRSKNPPWPGAPEDGTVKEVMRKLEGFDVIVTGDNHQKFVVRSKQKNRVLINPGSMLRLTAAQVDHEPTFYLVRLPKRGTRVSVEPVRWPIDKGALDTSHIDVKKEHDEKMDRFVQRLKASYLGGLSFEENIERYIRINKVPNGVKEAIHEAMMDD